MEAVLSKGKKWASISKDLVGRNEHSVKNHFFSLLHLNHKNDVPNEIIQNKIQTVLSALKETKNEEEAKRTSAGKSLKTKNEISLNNISLSNESFILAKKPQKKNKHLEDNEEMDNFKEEPKEFKFPDLYSHIFLNSLDLIRDDFDMDLENSKKAVTRIITFDFIAF